MVPETSERKRPRRARGFARENNPGFFVLRSLVTVLLPASFRGSDGEDYQEDLSDK
jgi:hypothetical protein